MKPNIHPETYRTVLFFDSSANEGWLIRSCTGTHGYSTPGFRVAQPASSNTPISAHRIYG